MKRVFYSWQSDFMNRTIIDALDFVKKQFDENHLDAIYIDMATRDETGAPSIPETINRKIELCDVFVADISSVCAYTVKSREKAAPNANVLIELGYAVAKHGWEKIVLLFNTSSGTISILPFDLDKRRIVDFADSAMTKKRELYNRIKEIIDYSSLVNFIYHGQNKKPIKDSFRDYQFILNASGKTAINRSKERIPIRLTCDVPGEMSYLYFAVPSDLGEILVLWMGTRYGVSVKRFCQVRIDDDKEVLFDIYESVEPLCLIPEAPADIEIHILE